MLVAVAAAMLVVGVAAALASAGASPKRPAITFVSPSPAENATVTSSSVTLWFTYNRTTKQTKTLSCTLSGPTSSSGSCQGPDPFGTEGSQSSNSYSGLANGSYTFTVALTLTDGGTASATRHFSVNAGHIYWANLNANSVGRANLDGTSPNQSFITGARNPLGVAVDSG